jgi:hypothetical protein
LVSLAGRWRLQERFKRVPRLMLFFDDSLNSLPVFTRTVTTHTISNLSISNSTPYAISPFKVQSTLKHTQIFRSMRMSPRQDTYLSLCREQAVQSPLHYRHGCIIIRGGKVIGKGYNRYRPGFTGEALKNGAQASTNILADMKQRKRKRKSKHVDTTSFGGRKIANNALSMHSEMMAPFCVVAFYP